MLALIRAYRRGRDVKTHIEAISISDPWLRHKKPKNLSSSKILRLLVSLTNLQVDVAQLNGIMKGVVKRAHPSDRHEEECCWQHLFARGRKGRRELTTAAL